jgi:uncharacterized protein
MVGSLYTTFGNIDSLEFNDYHKLLQTSTIFMLALFLFMSFSLQDNAATSQSYSIDVSDVNNKYGMNTNSTVYTSGSALTRLTPDRVIISIGVETTSKMANEALDLNSGLMNSIISELRNDGLKPNETSTSLFNIFPLYNYTESGTRVNVSGFTVTNTVQIESSKLDNVSQWIDTAVASGGQYRR